MNMREVRFSLCSGISLVCLTLVALPLHASAGDLDKANDIISGEDRSRANRGEKRSRTRVRRKDNNARSESGDEGDIVLGYVALYAFTFPWWGPYALIEGDDYPSAVGFREYPFQDGSLGHVTYPTDSDVAFARPMAGRIDLGLGYMGNDGWRASMRARWMHNSRFELDVGAIGFGEFDDGELDTATFFSAHAGYRFVETDTFTMRTGIGASFWQTQGLWAGGVDLYYGFDWFLVEPIVFSLNAELGSLGEAFRFGFQGSMGALIGRAEVYLGWEHFILANDVGAIELGGPQAGVRVWL